MKLVLNFLAASLMAVLLVVSVGGCATAGPYPVWASSPPGNPDVREHIPFEEFAPASYEWEQDRIFDWNRSFGHN